MASSIKGITVKLGADTTALSTALKDVNKESRDIQSELKQVERLLKLDPTNTILLNQKEELLNKSVDATNRKLETLKDVQGQIKNKLANGEIDGGQYRAFEREVAKTETELKNCKKQVDDIGNSANSSDKKIDGASKSVDELGTSSSKSKSKVKEIGTAVKDSGDKASSAKEGFTIFKGIVANLAASAIKSAVTGLKNLGSALSDSVSSAAEAGDAIDKQSQKMRVSSEEYQQLSYAAELSGTNVNILKKASKALTSAGSKIGLTDALKQCADSADPATKATEMFGSKVAQELAPMLNSGSKGIQQMLDSAKKNNMVIGEDAVKASAKYQDSLTTLKTTAGTIKNSLVSNLLPGVTQVTDGLTSLALGQTGATGQIEKGIDNVIKSAKKVLPRFLNIVNSLSSTIASELPKLAEQVIPQVINIATKLIATVSNTAPRIINSLVSGIINALPKLATAGAKLITSLVQVIIQQLPRILTAGVKILTSLVNGITQSIPRLAQQLPRIVTTIINVLIKSVPRILAAGTRLLSAIVKAIPRVVISLAQQLPTIINTISTTLLNSIDVIINAAVQMLSGIIDAIPQVIDALLQALPRIINTTVRTLVKALPKIINGAIKMLMGIIKAIPKIISAIVKNLPKIITCIVNGLISSIDAIIKGGIQLMMGLIKAIPIFITKLIPKIPTIVITIVKTLIKNLPTLIKGAVQLFMGIVKAIPKMLVELVKNLPQIVVAIVKGLASLGKEMWNIGKNVVQGLWNGIKNCVKWIKDKISGFVDGVVDGIKDFFGIHSPSTVTRDEVGRFVGEGIGVGIADSTKGVVANAKDQMRQVVDAYSSFDMPTLTPAVAGIATNSSGQLVADSNVLQSNANQQGSNGMTFNLNVDNFNNYSDSDLQSITRRMSELLAADIAQQQKAW